MSLMDANLLHFQPSNLKNIQNLKIIKKKLSLTENAVTFSTFQRKKFPNLKNTTTVNRQKLIFLMGWDWV